MARNLYIFALFTFSWRFFMFVPMLKNDICLKNKKKCFKEQEIGKFSFFLRFQINFSLFFLCQRPLKTSKSPKMLQMTLKKRKTHQCQPKRPEKFKKKSRNREIFAIFYQIFSTRPPKITKNCSSKPNTSCVWTKNASNNHGVKNFYNFFTILHNFPNFKGRRKLHKAKECF